MESRPESIHGQWSTSRAFVLAAIGAVAGPGNVWRFSPMATQDGGGAFVLLYLVCVLAFAVPLLMAAIAMGRRGCRNPADSLRVLAAGTSLNHEWKWLGGLLIVAGLMVLAYTSVIAGWVLAYIFRAATGAFSSSDIEQVAGMFNELISDPERMLAWHTLFMLMTVMVVMRDLKSGIEKVAVIVVPLIFVLLVALCVYGMKVGQFVPGFEYFLGFDFDELFDNAPRAFLDAAGQALPGLGLAGGAMMMYGAGLPKEASIPKLALIIVITDTLITVLAGMALYSLLIKYAMETAGGPALAFINLPILFGQIPGGALVGTVFFVLILLIIWVFALALLNPAVNWLVENKGMTRARAGTTSGTVVWILGVVMLLSFNHWSFLFSFAGRIQTNGLFDLFDVLTADLMLPLGGLLLAVFAGWRMPDAVMKEEMSMDVRYHVLWKFAIRFLTPAGMLVVLMDRLGGFQALQ